MATTSLDTARVADLIEDRIVGACCRACDHLADIPCSLIRTKFPSHDLIKELPRKFRCQHCGAKGNVELIVGHALGYPDNTASVSPPP